MKKIVGLILLLVFLSGCEYSVYPYQIKEAVDLCKESEGLFKIKIEQIMYDIVVCKNSERFVLPHSTASDFKEKDKK